MKRQENTLSNHELENLTAYLDGALSEKEKQRFEARLARSLPLQATLKEYTQLKAALRELPKQPAPRNFSLSPEQARAHKPAPKLYPAFGYIALTAALLLAVIFSSEFFFNQFSAPMATSMVSPELMATSPAPLTSGGEQESAPLIFTWGYPPGRGGGGGGMAVNYLPEKQTIAVSQAQDTFIAGGGMETPTPEAGLLSVPPDMGTGGGVGEEATPTPEAERQILSAEPEKVAVEPLILGMQADKAGQVVTATPQLPQVTATQSQPTRTWTRLVTDDVKIALAALAALFALLALVFYLKR
jgi:hypothetical protein